MTNGNAMQEMKVMLVGIFQCIAEALHSLQLVSMYSYYFSGWVLKFFEVSTSPWGSAADEVGFFDKMSYLTEVYYFA